MCAMPPSQATWGGYQDSTQTIADVGSGIGVVHNSYMFDRESIEGPLHLWPLWKWLALLQWCHPARSGGKAAAHTRQTHGRQQTCLLLMPTCLCRRPEIGGAHAVCQLPAHPARALYTAGTRGSQGHCGAHPRRTAGRAAHGAHPQLIAAEAKLNKCMQMSKGCLHHEHAWRSPAAVAPLNNACK